MNMKPQTQADFDLELSQVNFHLRCRPETETPEGEELSKPVAAYVLEVDDDNVLKMQRKEDSPGIFAELSFEELKKLQKFIASAINFGGTIS